MERRHFLKTAGLGAAALLYTRSAFASALDLGSKKDIGIGLFTLREQLKADVKGTLQKVAAIGYKDVETFYGYPGPYATEGFWNLTAKEFVQVLKDNGLKSSSGHYNTTPYLTDGNTDKLKEFIETAATVGQEYYVIPAMAPNVRQNGTIDGYKKMAELFNNAAELCKKSGLKLAYHNHDFEFKDLGDGQKGYQILLKETYIKFEMDIFWTVKAGMNPVQLFKDYKGRFAMWHVKDMDNSAEKTFTEVGSGTIDYKSIFANAKKAGIEHIYIEQDAIKKDAYESISQSFNYVKNTLLP